MAQGYPNMEALKGGVEAWKKEGLPIIEPTSQPE
jgi:rhodanese-related sulfurtransferase